MTVTIILGETILEVTGEYSPSTPDVHYLRNGNPGYPGESESFEIDTIEYEGKDITNLVESMNGLLHSLKRRNPDSYLHGDLWTEIEEKCIEQIN